MNTYDLSLIQNSKYVDNLYTYKSENDYNVGDIVQVGFGMGNKIVEGIIVQKNVSSITSKTKSIISSLDDNYSLSPLQIQTALFIKEQYMCSYYEAFKLFTSPSKYTKQAEKSTLSIKVVEENLLDELIKNTRANAKNKLKFLNLIKEKNPIKQAEIEEILDIKISSYIKELEQLNIIKTEKIAVFADKKAPK